MCACRGLQAGTVWVNTWNQFDAAVPFGGYKLSGIGREHGQEVLDHYTQVTLVSFAGPVSACRGCCLCALWKLKGLLLRLSPLLRPCYIRHLFGMFAYCWSWCPVALPFVSRSRLIGCGCGVNCISICFIVKTDWLWVLCRLRQCIFL